MDYVVGTYYIGQFCLVAGYFFLLVVVWLEAENVFNSLKSFVWSE